MPHLAAWAMGGVNPMMTDAVNLMMTDAPQQTNGAKLVDEIPTVAKLVNEIPTVATSAKLVKVGATEYEIILQIS